MDVPPPVPLRGRIFRSKSDDENVGEGRRAAKGPQSRLPVGGLGDDKMPQDFCQSISLRGLVVTHPGSLNLELLLGRQNYVFAKNAENILQCHSSNVSRHKKPDISSPAIPLHLKSSPISTNHRESLRIPESSQIFYSP